MSVSVIDRSFCSRIACVIGSFIIGYIAYCSFHIQTPLFKRSFGLKLR
nr:histidine kinase [Helicobacter pylori]